MPYLKACTIIQILILYTCELYCDAGMIQNLLSFCKQNGKSNLVIASFHEELPVVSSLIKKTYKYAVKTQLIPTRSLSKKALISNETSIIDPIDYDKELLILVTSNSNLSNWEQHLRFLSETKIMSSILVIAEPITSEHLHAINMRLRKFSYSSYFYMLFEESNSKENKTTWQEIITLQQYYQPIIRNMNFDSSRHLISNHDMNGIHIKCYTLSWAPYLVLSDCIQPNQTRCKSTGYLADVMDNLGNMFNFTWDCDKDLNDDWGALPISGM